MQILHCTDFHANKAWFDWLVERSADYSLACVTGDFLNLFEMHRVEDQVRMVMAAMQHMKCPLALCTGNHDSFTGPPAPEYLNHAIWLSAVRRESVWLDGDIFRIGANQFRCVGWNAILPPSSNHEIWLFHAPPARSLVAAGTDESDAGDEILGEVCRAGERPGIVLSGHQHNPRQWVEKVGNTWCFNPGVLRDAAIPNHIVIDLLAETATLRINDQDQARVCIVIDELHSFMGSERGKQLQSQLTRIERVLQRRICRIGLSATLGDMNGAKEFLRPGHGTEVELIEAREGGQELMVLLKGVLEPIARPDSTPEDEDNPNLVAKTGIVMDLFKTLRGSNNLVFPNSRSAVEFYADRLRRRCEDERVPNEFWPHHGNLSKEIREQTEEALKQKEMPATGICTSTLELGIDIGSVKCVAQIDPPPSVASLRQRLGRSGRRKGEPAILRAYAVERQLNAQSSPADELRAGLVQSVAMVRLLTRGWYEPIATDGLHASTMVQQLLSLISQYGGLTAGRLWEMLCGTGAFSAVSRELYTSLLRALNAKEIIFQDVTGLILLAPKGEQICGHYSFYAAFSSQEEFRIVTSGRTLGSMPVTRPLAPGSFVIFGGRRWQVLSVSQEELVIDVRPGAGGALPSFEGSSGAMIHDQVRAEMRTVLKGDAAVPFLDRIGLILLAEARDNYRRLGLNRNWIRQAGSEVHIYLWKGDRIHDTLTLILQARGYAVMNHGVYIEVRQSAQVEISDVLDEVLRSPPPDPLEIAASVQNKIRQKWDALLPADLLDAGFASENLEVAGTLAALRDATARTTLEDEASRH